ncbi:unnamed protein product [Closterium sp. NIES-65]|nr:unnamed protein product [Closterium sp. NIES-65]
MRNFRALSRDLSPFSTVSSVRGLAFAVLLLSPFLSPPSFCRPFDFVDPSDRGIFSNPPTFPSILFPNPPLPLPLNPTAPSSTRDAPLTPLQGLFEGGSGSPFLPFPPSAPLNQGYALDASSHLPSAPSPLTQPPSPTLLASPSSPPEPTVPFTPLQGFLRGAREWQVQERRAGRDGAIRARVVDERAPMAALAADGATPVVIRETNYGFSTCKVGGNGCRWVRLSVGGAGGGYPCACGGCAYGRGWSYSSGYPRNNGCRWAELGVSKTAIWFRPELLALAANISPPPTPPSSPPPTSPLQRQDTPAGVSETAIRFRPELLALAANISASMNGGDFDAVHVRRGDKLRPEFWPHLDHDTRPEALLEKLPRFVAPGRTLYIATNEKTPGFFDPLKAIYTIRMFQDFHYLWAPGTPWYDGYTRLLGPDPKMDAYMEARLSNEKTALVAMVKKLNRDVAKLETFKRTLMQQLQDENDDESPSMVSNRIRCSFLCLTPDVFYLPHLLHPYVSLLLPLITLTRPFLLLLLTPTFPSPPSFNLTHRFLLPYSQAAATAAAPKPPASEPTTASAGSGASAAKQAGDSASGECGPPSIAIPTGSNMGSSKQRTPLMTPSLVSPQYTPSATPPHSASGAPREAHAPHDARPPPLPPTPPRVLPVKVSAAWDV